MRQYGVGVIGCGAISRTYLRNITERFSILKLVGVAELAWAIRNNRPQRLSNEMGLHAIEIIHGAAEASRTGRYYSMTTPLVQMKPLRPGFIGPDAEGVFDD